MARTHRSGSLETRTARLRLKPRRKPYFTNAGKAGVHLGYRRSSAGSGSWVVKRYLGREGGGGKYETEAFAEADDYAEADGSAILTYFQAMQALGGALSEVQHRSRYSVNQAVEDYIAWLRLHRKRPRDTEIKLKAYFQTYFDGRELSSLTNADFEKWLAWAMGHKPQGRRKKGAKQTLKAGRASVAPKPEVQVDPSEVKRRRRSTLNRVINPVKACLNRAFLNGFVTSDTAWRRLRRFKNADSARIQWLSYVQAKLLIESCAEDFAQIVKAALLTGARWGELRSVRVRDYDSRSGTLLIAESKSDHSRRVPLSDEGREAFEAWAADRDAAQLLFRRTDGRAWGEQDQKRPMLAACKTAGIEPPVGFHALRHSYASVLAQEGVSLAVIAEALGHTDTRMVSKHYGHLAPSHVADAIRAKLPRLNVAANSSTPSSTAGDAQ